MKLAVSRSSALKNVPTKRDARDARSSKRYSSFNETAQIIACTTVGLNVDRVVWYFAVFVMRPIRAAASQRGVHCRSCRAPVRTFV